MAKQALLRCSVITPERQVLEREAASVVLPAHDGLIGYMRDRAPMVCEVGIGILTMSGGPQGEQRLFVDGGFAQVLNNDVTILTNRAMSADEIDRENATAAMREAEGMRISDDASFEARQKAMARAQTQLKLAK
ncbi:MAG: ATP synthase F1 subunit epsilon [Phycisphaerae bacterium]|nr:ATP synthase F1 subunit epsilon [Phycisphaerae bacterium]NUQ46728.1 ATP synthase F1 subunit epsilon [Phycisphaerae bacterium]